MKILLLLFLGIALLGSDYKLMMSSFDKGDINRAINITRNNAMKGNIVAMYDLGLLYYAKGDTKNAKTWLERSVKNDGKGQLGVSIILFTQSRNRNDYKKVWESLINAPKGELRDALMAVSRDLANNGHDASAENYLVVGELYSIDKIIRPDRKRTLFMMDQAAKKGSPKAKEMMGDAYWHSDYTVDTLIVTPSTANDLSIALRYYEEASELGNLDATAKMGKLHIIIDTYSHRSIQYGVEQILKSAEEGSAVGAKMAAELYMKGQGVRGNRQTAFEWYLKATDICDVNRILTTMYRQGDEADKYAKAYSDCSKRSSSKRKYHILFEAF